MAHTKFSPSQAVHMRSELVSSVRDIFSTAITYHLTHDVITDKMNKLRASEKYIRLTKQDQQFVEGYYRASDDAIWYHSPKLIQFCYRIAGRWVDSHLLTREDNDWLRANDRTNVEAVRAFRWVLPDDNVPIKFFTEPKPSYTVEKLMEDNKLQSAST